MYPAFSYLDITYELPPPVISYAYDPLGRLVDADYSTGESFEYQYDAVGNRKALTSTTPLSGTLVTTYTYDAANRLTRVGDTTYTWDERGNLTHDGTFTYTFNAAGRMVRAENVTTTLLYTYTSAGLSAGTADGLRAAQSVDGDVTTYAWDWASGLPEMLSDGASLYLVGQDTLGRFADGEPGLSGVEGWLYYLSDAEGLVRQGVDEQGWVVSNWLFDPDGTVLEGPEGLVSHLVCGGVYDWSTGLIYKDGRYFDPMLGIWLTMLPGMIKTPLDRSGVFGQSMALLVEPHNSRSRVTRGSMITSSFSKSSLKRHFCIVAAPMMSCCDRAGITINSSEKR